MKKLFLILSIVVFLISGCSFDVHMVTPAPAEATLPPVTLIAIPSDTPVSASTDLPVIGYTPDPGVSLFYGAHAVLNPTDPSGQSSFHVGTKRIYVVWNYQNMRAGQTIKREWYLDGRLWLQREEQWDFAKYGVSGIMQDVSIYDESVGLPSGVYQLQMYIDGLQQPIGVDTMFGPELWLNFAVSSEQAITETATSISGTLLPGDLGFGNITGKVTDAVTGLPIVNARVICVHYSYTSNEADRCNRTTTTDQDGVFLFGQVFFHDTDNITLTVKAPGYQSKEIKQAFFTMSGWKVDVSLNYPP